jgi:hypothetical protein
MDWLSDLPPLKGIDRVVSEMAQKLMSGPVIFKSPFWNGEVKIENLDDYRAWIRTVVRIGSDRDAEQMALEIWEKEKNVNIAEVRIP